MYIKYSHRYIIFKNNAYFLKNDAFHHEVKEPRKVQKKVITHI